MAQTGRKHLMTGLLQKQTIATRYSKETSTS